MTGVVTWSWYADDDNDDNDNDDDDDNDDNDDNDNDDDDDDCGVTDREDNPVTVGEAQPQQILP